MRVVETKEYFFSRKIYEVYYGAMNGGSSYFYIYWIVT